MCIPHVQEQELSFGLDQILVGTIRAAGMTSMGMTPMKVMWTPMILIWVGMSKVVRWVDQGK